MARPLRFEALNAARHDRTGFSCGIDQVDNYLRKTAGKLHKAGNVRVTVLVDAGGQLLGFHALNAHSVDYGDLPDRFARTRPRHGAIPAAFISMIGVDQRYQGRGFGGILLVEALKSIARVSETLGIAVVMMDVLDCGIEERTSRRLRLYQSYGFTALSNQPLRLYLPIQDARDLL